MAKPNYAFAKRQRDLAKKQKKEDKLRRKTEGPSDNPSQDDELQEVPPQTTDDEKPAD